MMLDVLDMKRAVAKIVPKLDIAQKILTTFNDDSDLLKKVITGDESRVYVYRSAHAKQFLRVS